MTAQIANGTPVTVYLAACNSSGLCGAWTGPSNQVTPYGRPNPPQVTGTPDGDKITWAWSGGGGNGRPVASYGVCMDVVASCTELTAPDNETITYGYSQTHQLYVFAADTAGQESTAATGTATTGPTPPPPRTLTVSQGGIELEYHAFPEDAWVHIAVSNFPADTVIKYSCTGSGISSGGSTYDTDSSGNTIQTDAAGSASFDSQYRTSFTGGGPTVTCTSDGLTSTGTFNVYGEPPGASLAITPGTVATATEAQGSFCDEGAMPCDYAHIVLTNFPPDSIVDYGCTPHNDGGAATTGVDSAGAAVVTDASGAASFETEWTFPASYFTPSGDNEVECVSDNVWAQANS
jgi:hypothetical protein